MRDSSLFLKQLLFVCTSIIFFHSAQADEFHYNNILVGDRASGLAGAYVAVSDDPSGLFYNPAGVVYAQTANISANMNAYTYSRTKYKSVLGGQDWIRTSSALVPNFFGITQPLGPGTLGFSYAVTDTILEDQDQTFNDIPRAGTKYTINFNNQDATNNVGPSYAVAIGNKFSIGLTLYGHFRNQQQIFNQSFDFAEESPDVYHWENTYVSLSEKGIKPILGMIFTPFDKISIGLSIQKTFLFSSKLEAQSSCAGTFLTESTAGSTCQPSEFNRSEFSNEEEREFPYIINTGFAWFATNKLMLTWSLWIYEPIHETKNPLFNTAGAIEYYFSTSFAIRIGGYTNLANTPDIKENAVNLYNEHVDIYGATLSFSHFTRTSAITFGAAGTYGSGKAQVISGNSLTQDVEYQGLTVFLSASNSF